MFNLKLRKKNKFFLSKQIIFTLIGLAVVVFISIPLAKNISKQYKINNEIKGLEKEIADFETKNLELKETLKYLESDQFAREQARINLNYKEAGEEVVVIKDLGEDFSRENLKKEYDANGQEVNRVAISNPSRWWCFFFLR